MGFFSKLKQKMGIGGVDVSLEMPTEVSSKEGILKGKIVCTTKSPQHVNSIKIIMRQVVTTGSMKHRNRRQQTSKLGDTDVNEGFDIKPGEERRLDFELPFSPQQNLNEKMADQGGVIGALGKVGSMVDDRHVRCYVVAQADVEGTLLGESKTRSIKLS